MESRESEIQKLAIHRIINHNTIIIIYYIPTSYEWHTLLMGCKRSFDIYTKWKET